MRNHTCIHCIVPYAYNLLIRYVDFRLKWKIKIVMVAPFFNDRSHLDFNVIKSHRSLEPKYNENEWPAQAVSIFYLRKDNAYYSIVNRYNK